MDIQYLKGVGESRARLFKKLGISDVDALLTFYPRSYIDFSDPKPIASVPFGEEGLVKCKVTDIRRPQYIRQNMTVFKVLVTDGVTDMAVTFFNNKYAVESMKIDSEYLFLGKITGTFRLRDMLSPIYRKADTPHKLEPVYRQTAGLGSAHIRNAVSAALSLEEEQLKETLPESIKQEYGLCHLRFALENIHFPDSRFAMEKARDRLIFDELLTLQLGMMMLKHKNREVTSVRIDKDYTDEFKKLLPFCLTSAQERAISDCIDDFRKEFPLNRLLEGDVGSGKTAVAAALMYTVVKNGCQCALMAPTEILAIQHHKSISGLLSGSEITVELLTGSTKKSEKEKIAGRLRTGETGIVIGTHALLSGYVEFSRLGLIVADEQHRFGVFQRAGLVKKGDRPHTLVMSATPIPRTLGLIIYGDLDISILDEMPVGRKPVKTYKIESDKLGRAYGFIKQHVDNGKQAFIVCPLVEESDDDEKASAVRYFEELSGGEFLGYNVGLVHGKMKPREKEQVMTDFNNNNISILVSTTVIEVGIDVPNAVVMLIENAELFGLSALHQLRGRVGRGEDLSYCVLVSDKKTEKSRARLDVLCKNSSGFRIAEEDLKMRGPGDFFGGRQHGLPELKIADFAADMDIVRKTKLCAQKIIENDSTLKNEENKLLGEAVDRLYSTVSGEGMN